MKYLLKRDYRTVVRELTVKKELKNHIVLESEEGYTYKINKKSVPYNENAFNIVSATGPYIARFYYIERRCEK